MGTSSFFFLGSIRYVISVSRVLAGGKAKCNVVVETEGRYTVPKHAGKILVTDDDQTSRESMQKVFERDGYVVEQPRTLTERSNNCAIVTLTS